MRDCYELADNMEAYQRLYNSLEGSFDGCKLNHISKTNNTEADELENIGLTRGPVPPGVFLESINQRSIKEKAETPEAVEEREDPADPAQVAAASTSEDATTGTPNDTTTAEIEGPAWTRPFGS